MIALTEKVISFNRAGYDPFIDFIKAYAIVCVLIGHTFPSLDMMGYGLWAGMQVPLFVLVQSFHFLKKENSKLSIKKIFWRVLAPFLIVEFALFVLLLLLYPHLYTAKGLIISYLYGGGTGPGSYYPWIYIQIALLLPLVKWLSNKLNRTQLLIVFFIVCEGLEVFSSLVHLPEEVHRLLVSRYLFLMYLGWLWVRDGIRINAFTVVLSILSLLSIIYFEYISVNDEPWFYNTSWKFHRWPCYYYVAVGGTYLLYLLYHSIYNNPRIIKVVEMLAKCSYEIFLIQMVVCSVCPSFDFIDNEMMSNILKILFIFSLSLIGGYYFNNWYSVFVRYVQ